MAKNKPLNPMAPPYQKLPPTPFNKNTFPHPTPNLLIFTPLIPYHVHFYPPRSFLHPPPPPSSSSFKMKKTSCLTPVPSGPRCRLPGRRRRVNKVVRPGNCNQTVGFEGRKRWKNTRRDYHQILPLDTNTTSVMIRNVPNEITRELLMQTLDNHCKLENDKNDGGFISAYDYLYLPIDFTNGANAGFAFVNFTNPRAALRFRDAFDGKCWESSDSRKVAVIARAKIQGKNAMVDHFKRRDFNLASNEDYLPVVFEPPRDGSGRANSQMVKLGKFPN